VCILPTALADQQPAGTIKGATQLLKIEPVLQGRHDADDRRSGVGGADYAAGTDTRTVGDRRFRPTKRLSTSQAVPAATPRQTVSNSSTG
jgi:hypothetical protein